MTILEVYKNLLRELDKFESPTFTVKDFNYFYNVAISRYITDNYGDFDVIQKDLDDIKALVIFDKVLDPVLDKPQADLPQDYRHCLSVKADLEFTSETLDNGIGDTLNTFPKRLPTNRKGYVEENAYQEPSPNYPMYQIDNSLIHILVNSNVTINEVSMDYIKTPATVTLVVGETPVDSEFSEYVEYEIIKVCRQIFLENIESPRYQSTINEHQLTKNKE